MPRNKFDGGYFPHRLASSGSGERDLRSIVLLLLGIVLFLAGQAGEGEDLIPFFPWRQAPPGLAAIQASPHQEGGPRLLLTSAGKTGVPHAPLEPPAALPASLTPFFFQPIPVNEANAALLGTVPGIGPVLAQRILALRETVGRFQSLEELLAVSGIGRKKLEKMRKHLRI